EDLRERCTALLRLQVAERAAGAEDDGCVQLRRGHVTAALDEDAADERLVTLLDRNRHLHASRVSLDDVEPRRTRPDREVTLRLVEVLDLFQRPRVEDWLEDGL